MSINYADLFNAIRPGFFQQEHIRSLPCEHIFEEQLLDLRTWQPGQPQLPCPTHITFGVYQGDIATLHAAVREAEDDWVEYFNEGDPVYCAFDGDKVVSFCLLDDFGQYEGLRIGAPAAWAPFPPTASRASA